MRNELQRHDTEPYSEPKQLIELNDNYSPSDNLLPS